MFRIGHLAQAFLVSLQICAGWKPASSATQEGLANSAEAVPTGILNWRNSGAAGRINQCAIPCQTDAANRSLGQMPFVGNRLCIFDNRADGGQGSSGPRDLPGHRYAAAAILTRSLKFSPRKESPKSEFLGIGPNFPEDKPNNQWPFESNHRRKYVQVIKTAAIPRWTLR